VVPAASPESVQLVTLVGDAAVGQLPLGAPPSRLT
jgi:hypothetical protein